jgi:hypothetical protein
MERSTQTNHAEGASWYRDYPLAGDRPIRRSVTKQQTPKTLQPDMRFRKWLRDLGESPFVLHLNTLPRIFVFIERWISASLVFQPSLEESLK